MEAEGINKVVVSKQHKTATNKHTGRRLGSLGQAIGILPKVAGTGEMAQKSTALAALLKDAGSGPSNRGVGRGEGWGGLITTSLGTTPVPGDLMLMLGQGW